MPIQIQCPACSESFSLREARKDVEWRSFCDLLVKLPKDVQVPLLHYLELFKPAKQQSVRSTTMLKLANELLPMIQSQGISRNGRHYEVSYSVWGSAMMYLSDRRKTLTLPLKGNGYLLETIAQNEERKEAKAEQAHIEKHRHAIRQGEMQSSQQMAESIAPTPTVVPASPKPAERTWTKEERQANMRKFAELKAGLGGSA